MSSSYFGSSCWNTLSRDLKNACSINTFKCKILQHFHSDCNMQELDCWKLHITHYFTCPMSCSAVIIVHGSLTLGGIYIRGQTLVVVLSFSRVWHVLLSQSKAKGLCKTSAVCMGAATQKDFISQLNRCKESARLSYFNVISGFKWFAVLCVVMQHHVLWSLLTRRPDLPWRSNLER